jgi:hypothetical protein
VVVVILSTELMRQPDPAQLPQPADHATSPASAEAAPATTQTVAPAFAPLAMASPSATPAPAASSPDDLTAAFVAAAPPSAAKQAGTDSAP